MRTSGELDYHQQGIELNEINVKLLIKSTTAISNTLLPLLKYTYYC